MWKTLNQGSAPLAATGVVMLVVLAGTLVGLAIDHRLITGAPAWLKPAKFAISIAIYTFTLAWIFSLLPARPRLRRIVGWTTAITMVLEMAIIIAQVVRGTTSHFNAATLLDGALFTVMGLAIVTQTLSTIAVAVALWKETLPDRALGRALRVGMILTIVGAMTGGLMTRPTPEQLASVRAGARLTISGAHTVGAPDGGPGLPGTGWSTEKGDLRVPHFVGLHAVQVLPLFVWLLARARVGDALRLRLTTMAAISYSTLFVLLLVEALRGQPVLSADGQTLWLLAGWAAATITNIVLALREQPLSRHATA